MSKWDAFFNANRTTVNKSSRDGDDGDGGRATGTIAGTYGQKPSDIVDSVYAANKAKLKIIQTLSVCDRLPKSPTFTIGNRKVGVEEGVMGAMGTNAAQLLDLAQQYAPLPGLGLGGSSSGVEEE